MVTFFSLNLPDTWVTSLRKNHEAKPLSTHLKMRPSVSPYVDISAALENHENSHLRNLGNVIY